MKKLLISALVAAVFSACSADPDLALLSSGVPRVEQNSRTILEYDENLHQIAFNPDDVEFRICTDNMTDFVRVVLDRIPDSAPSEVNAVKLQWSSNDDILSRSNVKMDVVKMEDDRIWLWSAAERIGICLKILK